MRAYHVGLVKGTGPVKYWANGYRADTVVVQMCRDIDMLSPDMWEYLGQREASKRDYKARKADILAWINRTYGTSFRHLVVE